MNAPFVEKESSRLGIHSASGGTIVQVIYGPFLFRILATQFGLFRTFSPLSQKRSSRYPTGSARHHFLRAFCNFTGGGIGKGRKRTRSGTEQLNPFLPVLKLIANCHFASKRRTVSAGNTRIKPVCLAAMAMPTALPPESMTGPPSRSTGVVVQSDRT